MFLSQVNSILCISEPYYTQVMSIHGDQNENERIDTDITDTQQWKVSECSIHAICIRSSFMSLAVFSHRRRNVCSTWN